MSLLRLAATFPLVLTLLAGCTSTPSGTGVSATGSMRLAVSTPEALPAEVSRVAVTVSGSDMPSITTELALTEGAWGGILGDIPAGTGRTFLAQAFTASNTLRYEGRAEGVTVSVGSMGLVSLTLQDVSPPPPFSNEAPVIDSLVASPTTVAPGTTLSLTSTAHDPNPGDTLTYAWSAPSGSFSAPTQANTTWTAPGTQGPVTLTLTVSDSRGAALAQRLTVSVTAGSGADEVKVGFNTAPRVVGLGSSQSVLDVGQQAALSVSTTDADGDTLSYQWTATCSGSFTGATSSSATFTPSALPTAACNNCQVLVTVKDGRGGQNTGSLALCVAKDSRSAPPSITRAYQSSLTAKAGQQLTFEVGASDPAGTALSFAWTASVGSLGSSSTSATSSRIAWTAPGCTASGSTPSLTVTVTNAAGLKVSKSFSVTGVPACGVASWSTTGSLGTSRYDHTATLLANGKVLVAGGYNGRIFLATAELYDATTGTWTSAGSMTVPRSRHTATLLPNGKVLVAGGINDSTSTSLSTTELYDPATGTWSSAGFMTSARYLHTTTLLANSKVLVTGGDGSSYWATAELYDPATGTWSPTGSMASVHCWHSAALLPNGKVLVAGGYTPSSSYLATAELYDPATGTWSSAGSMASARAEPQATTLSNGKVLVAGGTVSYAYLATAELYDPATGTWSPTGSMAAARYRYASTFLSNGKVLVTGGSDGRYLATAEVYDPATGSWGSAGSMSSTRQEHSATLLPNGTVLVAGGYNEIGSLKSAEVYNPALSP